MRARRRQRLRQDHPPRCPCSAARCDRAWAGACARGYGGVANARNIYAPDGEAYDFHVGVDAIHRYMAPMETGNGFRPEESVTEETHIVVRRERGADSALVMGNLVPARDSLAFRVAIDELSCALPTTKPLEGVAALGSLLARYRLYAHYDLRSLRLRGSPDTSERRLLQDGSNIFSVLRNWRDKKEDRHRYNFVLDALRDLFRDFFGDLDFSKTAQVIGAEVVFRGEKAISASLAPDGWFVALLHLTAVASTNSGDLIAIDEPENALHPHTIKLLLQHLRAWAQRHSTTILLATQSPVIIDTFRECPDRLYVMERAARSLPIRLSEFKDPEWLAHFSREICMRVGNLERRAMTARIGLITTGDCEQRAVVRSPGTRRGSRGSPASSALGPSRRSRPVSMITPRCAMRQRLAAGSARPAGSSCRLRAARRSSASADRPAPGRGRG